MTATKRSAKSKSAANVKTKDQDISKAGNEQEIEKNPQCDGNVEAKKRDTLNLEGKCKFRDICHSCTGYKLATFTTYTNFTNWLHRPVDASALGIFRMLYGKAISLEIENQARI